MNKLKSKTDAYYFNKLFNRSESYQSIKESMYRERKPNYKRKVNLLNFVLEPERYDKLSRIEDDELAGQDRLGKLIFPLVSPRRSLRKKGRKNIFSSRKKKLTIFGSSGVRKDRNILQMKEILSENRSQVRGLRVVDMSKICKKKKDSLALLSLVSPKRKNFGEKFKGVFDDLNLKNKKKFFSLKRKKKNFYSLNSEGPKLARDNKRTIFHS